MKTLRALQDLSPQELVEVAAHEASKMPTEARRLDTYWFIIRLGLGLSLGSGNQDANDHSVTTRRSAAQK